ncbi:hypothetical protein C5167_041001, partial [Papaver somniferum]
FRLRFARFLVRRTRCVFRIPLVTARFILLSQLLRIINGGGERKYPTSSFVYNRKG